jgi:hypothetical protein
MREAINNPGTMCPVRVVGSPGMVILHTCIECTTMLLGRFMDKGFVARQTFSMGVPAITETEVAPVSAMECVGGNNTHFLTGKADTTTCGRDMFDTTIVASSQLISVGSGAHVEISQLI